MHALAAIVGGLAVALLLPRARHELLSAVAMVDALVVVAFLSARLTVLQGGLALGGGVVLALLFARLTTRPFLFILLSGAFAALPLPATSKPWQSAAIGLAAVAIVIALVVKRELGVRVACGLLGARLAVLAVAAPPRWLFPAVALALVAASVATASRTPRPPPRWSSTALFAAVLGLLVGGLLLLLPRAAVPLSADPQHEPRLRKLQALAPQGGLVWPLPSESIFWDDELPPELFPPVDNLDALYLSGRALRGLAVLPGTTLSGRLSLRRDVERMRKIKDPDELAAMRRAAHATVEALRAQLALYRPGAKASDIAAAIHRDYLRLGCEADSFGPIVAAGTEGASPHGEHNSRTLREGDLVVTDIGCLANHYASDFTRTIPVGGFTARTRKLYEDVFAAQQAALAACHAGARLLGRKGSLDAIASETLQQRGRGLLKRHAVGHTVGLFVHDVDDGAPLEAGQVITIEPGLYLEGELGIRIEDTYLVREKDCVPLTEGMPGDAASMEALLREK